MIYHHYNIISRPRTERVAKEYSIPVVLLCDDNISGLLESRHIAKVQRRKSKNHLKGPRKRTAEDDKHFEASFRALILESLG